MKPKKLVISAFGPYGEKTVVDFEKLGETDPMFKKLAEIVAENNGLWCYDAEKYLLENAKSID